MNQCLKWVLALLLVVPAAHAAHHEGDATAQTVIGTAISDDGSSQPLYAGDAKLTQLWIDYIQAHNDRDFEAISAINAEDWEGFLPTGQTIKGNEAHIAFLRDWLGSSQQPTWQVKWIVTNDGLNAEGVMEHWLTTGNDITYFDDAGAEVVEHHVHDIQVVEGKIAKIYVYARAKTQGE